MLEGCKLAKVITNEKCTECPGPDKLQILLGNLLEDNDATEHVTFKHWISTYRLTPEATVKPSDEFTAG
jgi:hypothetical protein